MFAYHQHLDPACALLPFNPVRLFILTLPLQDISGDDPLSHLLLAEGVPALRPVLATRQPAVLLDKDKMFGQTLLHAAAALHDHQQRVAAVTAVTEAAATMGLTELFTARNGKNQLASSVCKNITIKKLIADAEQKAKRVAAAAKRQEQQRAEAAAAKAAAEAAKKAAAEHKAKEDQEAAEAAAAADQTAADEKAAAEAAATAAAAEAAQQTSAHKRPAVHAAPETDKQKRRRLTDLMSLIPSALQAAACPAPEVTAAVTAQSAAAARQLTSAARMARDDAIIKQRLQEVTPEQLPDKDVPLADGVAAAAGQEGDAAAQQLAGAGGAAAAGQQHASVADAAAAAAMELIAADDDDEDEDDLQEGLGRDSSGNSVMGSPACAAAATAAAAAVADIKEDSLDGLPWEFTISREALVAWMRLDRWVLLFRLGSALEWWETYVHAAALLPVS